MKSFLQKLLFWKSRVPRVALVRLTGIIAAGSSPLKRGLNLDSIDPVLKKAFGRILNKNTKKFDEDFERCEGVTIL